MDLERLSDLPPWDWPSDSSATILGHLTRTGVEISERRLAAGLAGNLVVMNDDLARALVAIVLDAREDEEVRSIAAISLGPVLEELDGQAFDDPYDPPRCSEEVARLMQRSLAEVCRDANAPRDVRRRALEAAVRCEGAWHEGAVRAAYYDGDPAWRVTAVFCMQYVPGFDREILEALASDDPGILYEAVRTAGNRQIVEAWPRIRVLLDPEETGRDLLLAAIEAAGNVGDHEEVEEALDPLLDLGDEEIAEAVADATAELELWAGMDEPDLDEIW
jgi:hypothetical protein